MTPVISLGKSSFWKYLKAVSYAHAQARVPELQLTYTAHANTHTHTCRNRQFRRAVKHTTRMKRMHISVPTSWPSHRCLANAFNMWRCHVDFWLHWKRPFHRQHNGALHGRRTRHFLCQPVITFDGIKRPQIRYNHPGDPLLEDLRTRTQARAASGVLCRHRACVYVMRIMPHAKARFNISVE